MSRGHVVDETGEPLNPASRYKVGACISYYRELETESRIPFSETIIYQDEDLLVVDKPHFLPVVPSGRFLRETLLAEAALRRGLFKPDAVRQLVELHTRGERDYSHQLWTLLMLELWFQRFID